MAMFYNLILKIPPSAAAAIDWGRWYQLCTECLT